MVRFRLGTCIQKNILMNKDQKEKNEKLKKNEIGKY